MRKGILFATPCYGGMMTAQHYQSSMNLKETLSQVGLAHDWLLGWNESLVHRARMEMTAKFLASDWSHMMWLDADIEYEPDHVAQLWNMDADIAVGVYAMKKRNESWYAAWVDGELVKNLGRFTKPIEVDFAGTGFMLIKREVIEGVHKFLIAQQSQIEQLLWRLAGDTPLPSAEEALIATIIERFSPTYQGVNGAVPAVYMTPIHNGGLESEDYHFCRIAREAGFKIMMDPSVRLKHWGQFSYP